MGVDFFGDFIAASKGRAIDLSLSGRYRFSENLQLNIGYRLLEGGANGTNRYNFVQLHFVFVGLNYTFNKNNRN
jgi:predicted porin